MHEAGFLRLSNRCGLDYKDERAGDDTVAFFQAHAPSQPPIPMISPHRNEDGTLKVKMRAAVNGAAAVAPALLTAADDAAMAPYEAKMKRLVDNAEEADRAYDALPEAWGGKVINTDIARYLLPEYAASRNGRIRYLTATNRISSAYAKDRLWREIDNPRGRRRLMFTAGGVATGKSTAITRERVAATDLIFDGTVRDPDWAIRTIEHALTRGWGVLIHYVQRPMHLAVEGILTRVDREGRWGPLAGLPYTHRAAQQSFLGIAKHFAGNPSVLVRIWLNDGTSSCICSSHAGTGQIPGSQPPRPLTLDEIDAGGAWSYGATGGAEHNNKKDDGNDNNTSSTSTSTSTSASASASDSASDDNGAGANAVRATVRLDGGGDRRERPAVSGGLLPADAAESRPGSDPLRAGGAEPPHHPPLPAGALCPAYPAGDLLPARRHSPGAELHPFVPQSLALIRARFLDAATHGRFAPALLHLLAQRDAELERFK